MHLAPVFLRRKQVELDFLLVQGRVQIRLLISRIQKFPMKT